MRHGSCLPTISVLMTITRDIWGQSKSPVAENTPIGTINLKNVSGIFNSVNRRWTASAQQQKEKVSKEAGAKTTNEV